jgi:hypothetical protein
MAYANFQYISLSKRYPNFFHLKTKLFNLGKKIRPRYFKLATILLGPSYYTAFTLR